MKRNMNQNGYIELAKLYRKLADAHMAIAENACDERDLYGVTRHVSESRKAHMSAEKILGHVNFENAHDAMNQGV